MFSTGVLYETKNWFSRCPRYDIICAAFSFVCHMYSFFSTSTFRPVLSYKYAYGRSNNLKSHYTRESGAADMVPGTRIIPGTSSTQSSEKTSACSFVQQPQHGTRNMQHGTHKHTSQKQSSNCKRHFTPYSGETRFVSSHGPRASGHPQSGNGKYDYAVLVV